MTARKLDLLPGEDPALRDLRIDGYKADLQPRGTHENELVERMAQESWMIDRALRADAARVAIRVETMAAETALRENDEAAALGQRLFFDRRGSRALYPSPKPLIPRAPVRTSYIDQPDDPDDPVRLLIRLESNGAGCQWLLDRWAELLSRLEAGQFWQSPEKLKAIRLLGRQPLDAADDRDVADVFLACDVLDPQHKNPFFELRSEMDDDEWKAYSRRLEGRNLTATRPADASAALALLVGLIARVTGRLNVLAAAHQERAARVSALMVDAMAFDDSPEGERLWRYKDARDRAHHRAFAAFLKSRKELEIPECDTTLPEDTGEENDPAPSSLVSAQAEPGADSTFGPTADSNGNRENEPETAAGDDDLQTEDAAGAQDTASEADAAYRELLEAALAGIRDPGAEPPLLDTDRLEEAIVLHAAEVAGRDEIESAGDRENDPTAAAGDDPQTESIAGAGDSENDPNAAYREALQAAVACIRNPETGPPKVDMDRIKKAIFAQAAEIHRFEELEKKRREFYDRDPKYRVDAYLPAPARPAPGSTRPAWGNPKHQRDRRRRNQQNNQ